MARLINKIKSPQPLPGGGMMKRKLTQAAMNLHPGAAAAAGRNSTSTPAPVANSFRYTEEELQEFREVFSLFDKDGSGAIGYAEMEEAMYSLGMKPSKQEINELIREIDADGNGEIDFDEFCMVMEKMTKKKDNEQDIIRQCFEVFDRDGDGMVHEKEFRKVCLELGGISEKVADEVFQEADVASNGRLDYDEFAQMVTNYLFSDDNEG